MTCCWARDGRFVALAWVAGRLAAGRACVRLAVASFLAACLVFARLRVIVVLLRYLRGNVSFVDRKEESV